jgi:hypothetical protein
MTEYNFRHQTKMKSIKLAGFRGVLRYGARCSAFSACFLGFADSRPALAPGWLA